eukprot:TRINITY_DN5092_c0_g1_i1.p1 TRINITY_DN5092_c0_g1~~TRINITY_DN5092_c0_g1_i1.p1  ORF type:complete len:311 (+),score=25.03 TRINITY_DN5092_c0_g1_i1:56-988(+)
MANSGRSVLLLLIGFALGAVVANLLFWPFHDGHHDVDGAAETAETESNRLADVALRHDVRSITRQTTLAWTSTAKVETTWSTTSTTPKPASTTASTIAITTTRALASHLQLIYSPEDQRKLAIPDSAKWTVSHGHYGPIVDKKHKLVFCSIPKAACTIWRQLLRRLNGADDYDTTDERITHHYGGKSSGLTYLAAFSDEEANAIMTNPEYVKVAVVRNPYTRILSAWRDKFGPGEAHNWGKIPWTSFVKSRLGSSEYLQLVCLSSSVMLIYPYRAAHWSLVDLMHSIYSLSRGGALGGHVLLLRPAPMAL